MDSRHIDVREELAAVIAAGRELPPDHDRALVDAFLDRMQRSVDRPPRTSAIAGMLRKPRRFVGGLVALACLGVGSLLMIQQSSGASSISPQSPIMAQVAVPHHANVGVGKLWALPQPVVIGAKSVLHVPKAPLVPPAPKPQTAP